MKITGVKSEKKTKKHKRAHFQPFFLARVSFYRREALHFKEASKHCPTAELRAIHVISRKLYTKV